MVLRDDIYFLVKFARRQNPAFSLTCTEFLFYLPPRVDLSLSKQSYQIEDANPIAHNEILLLPKQECSK